MWQLAVPLTGYMLDIASCLQQRLWSAPNMYMLALQACNLPPPNGML